MRTPRSISVFGHLKTYLRLRPNLSRGNRRSQKGGIRDHEIQLPVEIDSWREENAEKQGEGSSAGVRGLLG